MGHNKHILLNKTHSKNYTLTTTLHISKREQSIAKNHVETATVKRVVNSNTLIISMGLKLEYDKQTCKNTNSKLANT